MADVGVWRLDDRRLPFDRPRLMAVVNVTPDSFSDGGLFADPADAIAHGRALIRAGADIVDVGGESTRPRAEPVDAATEKRRVLPVIEALAGDGAIVSVDTAKSEVAAAAVEAGALIVNDITAGGDPEMLEVVKRSGAGLVLMHMKGTPRTMQDDPRYDDVVTEVRRYLVERATRTVEAGVGADRVVIDPGIGFGKTTAHNLELLRRLDELVDTGYPVLVGASRKAFLGKITGLEDPRARDVATAATTALAVAAGAAIVRVHDVESSRQAAAVAWAISHPA
ncbi:MAG TPA: dihydropteroate synthase [Acidimicrobiia bacterium]|nr:dihydropteroate synthase [Acidimicrobiia bacterium]